MIAIDTNIRVYAHRRDSSWHVPAARRVREAAEGRAPWALPWPCLDEFLAIATHPRLYSPPSTLAEACAQVGAWLESPSVVLLSETDDHWLVLKRIAAAARITGPVVHDARIAAICLQHGVSEFWSADRDFSRFPELKVRNPLV